MLYILILYIPSGVIYVNEFEHVKLKSSLTI